MNSSESSNNSWLYKLSTVFHPSVWDLIYLCETIVYDSAGWSCLLLWGAILQHLIVLLCVISLIQCLWNLFYLFYLCHPLVAFVGIAVLHCFICFPMLASISRIDVFRKYQKITSCSLQDQDGTMQPRSTSSSYYTSLKSLGDCRSFWCFRYIAQITVLVQLWVFYNCIMSVWSLVICGVFLRFSILSDQLANTCTCICTFFVLKSLWSSILELHVTYAPDHIDCVA